MRSRPRSWTTAGADLPAARGWKFHPGDDPAFAAAGFDDGALAARSTPGCAPASGRRAGTASAGSACASASRPACGGVPLGPDAATSSAPPRSTSTASRSTRSAPSTRGRRRPCRALQRRPHLFSFDDREEHVLAVRFCNHDAGPLRGGRQARPASRSPSATANRRARGLRPTTCARLAAYQAFVHRPVRRLRPAPSAALGLLPARPRENL